MTEAAGHGVGQQSIQHRQSILDKAAVADRIDTQRCQCDQHLRAGLAVQRAPAAVAAVGKLHIGQKLHALVHGGVHRLVAGSVGRQRLQGHGRHIRVGAGAGQCPASIRELLRQNVRHQTVTGDLGSALRCGGHVILAAVQRQQREDSAVDALIRHIVHVGQSGQQVVASHISGILSDGRQRQNGAGILGGFLIAELPLGALHRLDHAVIVAVGHIPAAARQRDHQPLAAEGQLAGLDGVQRIAVCLAPAGSVSRLRLILPQGLEDLRIGRLRRRQLVVVGDQFPLIGGELVVGCACGGDGVAAVLAHGTDGVDELDDVGCGDLLIPHLPGVRIGLPIGGVVPQDVILVSHGLLRQRQAGQAAVDLVQPAGVGAGGELAIGDAALGHGADISALCADGGDAAALQRLGEGMIDSAALLDCNALAEPSAVRGRDGHRDSDVLALRRLLRGLLRGLLRLAGAGGVSGFCLTRTEVIDVERLARRPELCQRDQRPEALLGGSVIIGNIVRKAEAGVVRQSKGHQALHHGQTVPAEPRILFRIHAHRRQADDDHGR